MSEQPVVEQVLVTKSLTGHGAAITQTTTASEHVSIHIPAGKGGILYAVSLSMTFVPTDGVHAGGAVSFACSNADWDPFYLTTGMWVPLTEGGDPLKPFVFECFKKMPGNATVTVDYTPYNALSQYLEVTLHWIMTEADPVVETFVDIVHPLYADKVSSTAPAQVVTSWAHNAGDFIHVPQGKEGTLKAFFLQLWPYPTTVVVGGGICQLFCDAYDTDPVITYNTMATVVGASGCLAENPMVVPVHQEVKHTTNWTANYTPRNAMPQSLTWGIVWERPYRPKQ